MNIKKIFLAICLVVSGLFAGTSLTHADECWVTTENDDDSDMGSLRSVIENTYNGGPLSNCTPPSASPGDADYFDQVVLFATDEIGATNNIETIILDNTLTFDNDDLNIAIGNWSETNVTDNDTSATYDNILSTYSTDYENAITRDYGLVTINAQDNFAADEAPFICASETQEVYFRNVAILTNGLSDLYVILGPYQGEKRWLLRASHIPLAPWIWIGGFLIVGGPRSFLSFEQVLILRLSWPR